MNTNSDKTEEILFQTMREGKKGEITPKNALKTQLDKALASKRRENSFFTRQIFSYQSVAAAAAIFFLLGFGSSFLRPAAPPQIMHTTSEVVKYVDRPVVTEVVKYVDRPVVEIRYVKQPAIYDTGITQNVVFDNSNESSGISLREDTILQKMLIQYQYINQLQANYRTKVNI